ncbi:hypothetical protein Taro_020394 [Colocasia esculenta]|uniref:Protein RCC2 n=1 Tax=Colocasia esculenta TaxID=4460 RepID=A0A843V279_COLES|nr:hypothetical protein [Colocasia esculenta]
MAVYHPTRCVGWCWWVQKGGHVGVGASRDVVKQGQHRVGKEEKREKREKRENQTEGCTAKTRRRRTTWRDVQQKHKKKAGKGREAAEEEEYGGDSGGGQLYMWGKLKNTGDDWMYPKPVLDLSGWNIRCMDSGNMHHVVGADESCISWGVAQNGELGYGPLGQKSSANPKKIDILEGMHVASVACGMGLSLIVVDRTNIGDQLDQLEVYDGDASAEVMGDAEKEVATTKKRAADSSGKAKKKRKKSSSESDDEYGASDNSDDANGGPSVGKRGRGGKTSGRGRIKNAKNSTKKSGRGRGRPTSDENNSGRGRVHSNAEEKAPARGRGRGRAGKKARNSSPSTGRQVGFLFAAGDVTLELSSATVLESVKDIVKTTSTKLNFEL